MANSDEEAPQDPGNITKTAPHASEASVETPSTHQEDTKPKEKADNDEAERSIVKRERESAPSPKPNTLKRRKRFSHSDARSNVGVLSRAGCTEAQPLSKPWWSLSFLRKEPTMKTLLNRQGLELINDDLATRLAKDAPRGEEPSYHGPRFRQMEHMTHSASGVLSFHLETNLRQVLDVAILHLRRNGPILSAAPKELISSTQENYSGSTLNHVLSVANLQDALATLGLESVERTCSLPGAPIQPLRGPGVHERFRYLQTLQKPNRKLIDIIHAPVNFEDPDPRILAGGGVGHHCDAQAARLKQSHLAIEGVQVDAMVSHPPSLELSPPPTSENDKSDAGKITGLHTWAYQAAANLENLTMASKLRVALKSLWLPPAPTQGNIQGLQRRQTDHLLAFQTTLSLLKTTQSLSPPLAADMLTCLMSDLISFYEIIEGANPCDKAKQVQIAHNAYDAVSAILDTVECLYHHPATDGHRNLLVHVVPILHYVILAKYIGGRNHVKLIQGINLRRRAAKILARCFESTKNISPSVHSTALAVEWSLLPKVADAFINQLSDAHAPVLISQIGAVLGIEALGTELTVSTLLPLAHVIDASTFMTSSPEAMKTPSQKLNRDIKATLRSEYLRVVIGSLTTISELSFNLVLRGTFKDPLPRGGRMVVHSSEGQERFLESSTVDWRQSKSAAIAYLGDLFDQDMTVPADGPLI